MSGEASDKFWRRFGQWAAAVVAITAIYALLLVYLSSASSIFPGAESIGRGEFGDMFGALTALFSGLAFAGLIVTLQLQREDLKMQRDELRLQREELANSVRAQKEHVAATREGARAQNLLTVTNLLDSREARRARELTTKKYRQRWSQEPHGNRATGENEQEWGRRTDAAADTLSALDLAAYLVLTGVVDHEIMVQRYGGTMQGVYHVLGAYIHAQISVHPDLDEVCWPWFRRLVERLSDENEPSDGEPYDR